MPSRPTQPTQSSERQTSKSAGNNQKHDSHTEPGAGRGSHSDANTATASTTTTAAPPQEHHDSASSKRFGGRKQAGSGARHHHSGATTGDNETQPLKGDATQQTSTTRKICSTTNTTNAQLTAPPMHPSMPPAGLHRLVSNGPRRLVGKNTPWADSSRVENTGRRPRRLLETRTTLRMLRSMALRKMIRGSSNGMKQILQIIQQVGPRIPAPPTRPPRCLRPPRVAQTTPSAPYAERCNGQRLKQARRSKPSSRTVATLVTTTVRRNQSDQTPAPLHRNQRQQQYPQPRRRHVFHRAHPTCAIASSPQDTSEPRHSEKKEFANATKQPTDTLQLTFQNDHYPRYFANGFGPRTSAPYALVQVDEDAPWEVSLPSLDEVVLKLDRAYKRKVFNQPLSHEQQHHLEQLEEQPHRTISQSLTFCTTPPLLSSR